MMRWFKRRTKTPDEPGLPVLASEAAAQGWQEQKLATGEPRFVSKHTQDNGAVYETYHASDVEVAKTFLMGKHVDREFYYIVVETPEGNWGVDIQGLYLEKLMPWQLNTRTADCVGQIHSVTSIFGLTMSVRGSVDNYLVQVQCGRCTHLWQDGLRYQDETVVRCPNCKARNNVDSSGVTVTITEEGEQQRSVITSSHVITDESWLDPGLDDGQEVTDDGQEVTLVGVDQAIVTCREKVAATPPEHPHRPGRLANLGRALHERFMRTGRLTDLDEAVTAFTEAVATTPSTDPDLPGRLSQLGLVLSDRFERTGRLADLNDAITAFTAAAASTPPTDPDLPGRLSRLGLALRDRFERTGRLADLNDAVTAGRDAVTGTPPDHTSYPANLTNLAATLRVRFEHTGRQTDLDEAIAAGRKAVAGASADHPDHFACRGTLGLALQERFKCTGHLADVEEAISAFMDAVATIPPDHPNHSRHQGNLSRALHDRFQRTGQPADLDGAIAAAREAIAGIRPDDPNYAKCVSTLGGVLHARFELTGQLTDLDEAVIAVREAVANTPPDHSDRPLVLAELGVTLLGRFGRTGQLGDLSEAINAVRDAVNGTSSNHPDRPGYLDTFGIALHTRFLRTGRLADLDEAIAAGRDAVAGTSSDHPIYPRRLSNLGAALYARFQRTGHLADLDESTTAGSEAIAAIPPGHPDRHVFMFNQGLALHDRFERSGELADLDEAITAGRDAIAAIPPGHPNHPTYLSGLSFALRIRYGRTGQPDDLDEAIGAAREAVTSTPPNHPDRAGRLINLSLALHFQFERTGQPADLDGALSAARDAVNATQPNHPSRANRLSVLGVTLQTRFRSSGQQADLEQAIAAFMDAVNVESGPPEDRMNAGRAWGGAAIEAGRAGSAADGFAAAVRLLPLFAWHGLPRATREEHVAEWGGLAADAAACAVRAGRPEQAVELLEAGRSVLWAQIFNLRTDLTDLAEREPDLATRLHQIRTLLDAPLPATPALPIPAGAGDGIEQLHAEQNRAAENRMRLAREFDELVSQVRAVDGFENFLKPISFAQLRVAASGGPVVIVNTSRYGCHALLVTTTGVQVVDLPDLTRQHAVARGNTLLGILARATHSDRRFLDRERDRHTVLDILGWLWDAVAEPVLTRLGHTSPPAPGAAWPRIWWCPTGRLTLLPLHAAGQHHRHHRPGDRPSTDTVPDRVISSYTPTLTALLRARATPVPTAMPALLAIGMPTTPGTGDLPAVPAELDRVHARYPITTRLQSPAPDDHPDRSPDPGSEPTIARVLAELPRHAWVHLSCHGSQHFRDPAASAFWLSDGPLRIADLIQHEAGFRELAFLSACQTAAGGLRAMDEAIHLAAAMQLLGYRHVIATLWSIYDSLAPDIADTVYATLTTGIPDAANALHHAVAVLRAHHPTDPLAWAPYVHTGP